LIFHEIDDAAVDLTWEGERGKAIGNVGGREGKYENTIE